MSAGTACQQSRGPPARYEGDCRQELVVPRMLIRLSLRAGLVVLPVGSFS